MNKHITDSKKKLNLQQSVDLGRESVDSNVSISKVNAFLRVKRIRNRGNCKQCGVYYEGAGKMFCSSICSNKEKNIGKVRTDKFIQMLKNRVVSNDTREKLRKINLGKKYSEEIRRKKSILFRGEQNPSYKGNVSSIQNKVRGCLNMLLWKEKVLKLFNYTCFECGSKKNIQTDHKKSFHSLIKKYKITSLQKADKCKALWDIKNGQVLCLPCHRKRNKFQAQEWAKLTKKDVLFIRSENGLSWSQMAKKFNVTKSCIGSVIKNRSWKHI